MKTPEKVLSDILNRFTGVKNISFTKLQPSNNNFTIHCMKFDTDDGEKEFGIETFSTYNLNQSLCQPKKL